MTAPKTQKNKEIQFIDNGGLAPARHFCPHIVDGISIPSQSLIFPDLSISQNIKCVSDKCDYTDSNGCWLCLSCYKIYCGRYGNKHMIYHKTQNNNHMIALCCGDLSFWCYKCDDYLDHLSISKVFKLYQIAHQSKFKEKIPNLQKLMQRCNFKQQDLFMKYLKLNDQQIDSMQIETKENKDNENDIKNDNNVTQHKNTQKTRNPLANPLNKNRYNGTSGASTALSDEQIKEYNSSNDIIRTQAIQCAEILKNASHVTVYTGAGISTAADIPDFRGPQGVWTLANKGISRSKKTVSLQEAIPTYSHLALVKMIENGLINYVVSTNVDGMHMRSGVGAKNMSELHGNIYIEFCNKCGTEYHRPFVVKGQVVRKNRDMNKLSRRFTGRLCDDINCNGKLRDSIIGFGENLPENEFIDAIKNSAKSDVVIVIGSSMTVTPANDLPSLSYFRNGKFILINLQKTNYDRFADVRVFAKCDEFMKLLCCELNIDKEIKVFDTEKEIEQMKEQQQKLKKVIRIDPEF